MQSLHPVAGRWHMGVPRASKDAWASWALSAVLRVLRRFSKRGLRAYDRHYCGLRALQTARGLRSGSVACTCIIVEYLRHSMHALIRL